VNEDADGDYDQDEAEDYKENANIDGGAETPDIRPVMEPSESPQTRMGSKYPSRERKPPRRFRAQVANRTSW
jgi:hypothetical protein